MLNRKNLWMVMLFVITLLTSNFQVPVLAADQVSQGTVTVIGMDAEHPILDGKSVQTRDKETALEALVDAIGQGNVELTDTKYGKMINGINGVKADNSHFWAFFINGISAQVGADGYLIQKGDNLTFRLTDFTQPQQNTVSLKVMDSKQNTVKSYSDIGVIGSPSAVQLLQVLLGNENVGFTETQYGKMITSLNGMEAGKNQFWAFYVDGKMANVGADSYKLQGGNQISFQLESFADSSDGGANGEAAPTIPSGSISKADLQKAINNASQYVLKSAPAGEWEVISLKQAGKSIPGNYLSSVETLVKDKQGKFNKITDTERYVLGILAAGGNPTNVAGYDLVKAIYDGNVTKQGLIGVSYALVALDSANFTVSDSAEWTREKLIKYLTESQNADGGWAWDGSLTSDPDTTAMILTALAPYQNQADVREKVKNAVNYLSGQFKAGKIDNSSTAAQAIIALTALNINPQDALFSKDNTGIVQYFLSFQNMDGGFDWQGGDESDAFTTSQAFQALVAYQLFTEGKGSIYHLPLTASNNTGEVAKPEKEQSASTQVKEQGASTGHSLPNTATNAANLVLAGLLLIIIGSGFYFVKRRQNA